MDLQISKYFRAKHLIQNQSFTVRQVVREERKTQGSGCLLLSSVAGCMETERRGTFVRAAVQERGRAGVEGCSLERGMTAPVPGVPDVGVK